MPLTFAFGASGQRFLKTVSDPDLDVTGSREHYIRDAQGNIMATYRYTNPGSASLQLNDRPLYGSARLGTLGKEMELHSLLNWDPADPVIVDPVDLNYELTDHLGNVCTVVTGRLMDGNGGGTLKQAELVSAQGYEPFGSILPARNYSNGAYRFGFHGKESDTEVLGAEGTIYDYGFRIYDTRLARFLSVDPLVKSYPFYSPYHFAGNSPIKFIDIDGLEVFVVGTAADELVNLLAQRSGLTLCKDASGMLTYASQLVTNGDQEQEVPIISVGQSEFVSVTLRNELIAAINGGDRSVVTLIAHRLGQDREGEYCPYEDNVFFEGFDYVFVPGSSNAEVGTNGVVDVGDFERIGCAPELQAAILTHAVTERSSCAIGEDRHNEGLLTESAVISEMCPMASVRIDIEAHLAKFIGRSCSAVGYNTDEATGLFFDYGEAKYMTVSPAVMNTSTGRADRMQVNHVTGVIAKTCKDE